MSVRLPGVVRWAAILGLMLLSVSTALGTQQPIEVRVNVAERQTAYRRITYGARLRPRQTVSQRAPQSGLVYQIAVQPGQAVARGDLLMSLRRDVPTDSFRPVAVQSFHDGVIAAIAVYEGQEVRDGDTLVTIADTSSFTAELLVSDKDIDAIRVGAPVTAVDSQRDRTFSGRVTRSALIPDYATGLFSVEVSVNPGPGAFVGQFLRFSFRTGEISAILVAREHLEYRGGRYHLYVVEDGRAVLRAVTPGAEYEGKVVIRDGLHEGERYVISAARRLQDGASVTVRE